MLYRENQGQVGCREVGSGLDGMWSGGQRELGLYTGCAFCFILGVWGLIGLREKVEYDMEESGGMADK